MSDARPVDAASLAARTALHDRAADWRRLDTLGWTAAGAVSTAGAALGAVRHPVIGGAIALSALAALLLLRRRAQRLSPLDARTIAARVNGAAPAAQASADLFLAPTESLSFLGRLQLARVAPAVQSAVAELRFPRERLRAAALVAGAAFVLGAATWFSTPQPAAPAMQVRGTAPAAPVIPSVRSIAVDIAPPAYTGRPTRRTTDLDLEVESGARVTWTLAIDAASMPALRLATSDRDTLGFTPRDDGRLSVSLAADHPLLYEILAEDSLVGRPTGVRRLAVVPDRAPLVTVVRPEERTTVDVGDPLVVPVEVLGRDDYGLRGAEIVATVTTGSGENVKFREQRLPFTSSEPRGAAARVWRTALDLERLGVKPGDELYFHVLAADNRTPSPNEGRSETVFIRRVDTARVALAEFSGLALKVAPDYFRSQRQIIIDTEKLLAEQGAITLERFRERSSDIGIDQHLLRVRYGELVGDENESGLGSAVAERLEEAGIETGESHAHEAMPQPEGLMPGGAMPTIPEDAVHRHDDSENATRLAADVKATLQAALREMWSAERHLRTYDPRKALPYEYRALEYLKEIQQAARVYVKRVGFEPPPLSEEKRLGGKLDRIRDVRRDRAVEAQDRFPAVRALLAHGLRRSAEGRRLAQAAGEELAREALALPGAHLDALRDLRRWLDADASCASCTAAAAQALYAVVPDAAPTAAPRAPLTTARRALAERLRALR